MKRLAFAVIVCVLLAAAFCPAAFAAESHYMGDWHYIEEDQHWAECVLCENFVLFRDCSSFSCEYEGQTLRVCPVCGHSESGDGTIVRGKAYVYDYANSPIGDLLVIRYDLPFGEDSDVPAAYSVIFEYAGEIVDFDGSIALSIPMAAGSYEVFQADGSEINEIEATFDSETGTLNFAVTDGCGLFLLKQA